MAIQVQDGAPQWLWSSAEGSALWQECMGQQTTNIMSQEAGKEDETGILGFLSRACLHDLRPSHFLTTRAWPSLSDTDFQGMLIQMIYVLVVPLWPCTQKRPKHMSTENLVDCWERHYSQFLKSRKPPKVHPLITGWIKCSISM